MDRIFSFLTELSGGAAYLVIFGILVACGLGLPLPEDMPLISTGYLVWNGTMSWAPAILMTMGGVLIGDTILFFIGRKLGLKVLDNGRMQTIIKPRKVRRVRAYFRKYGDKIVFFARFVAGFRAAAFFLAGALRMKYTRFLLLDGFAALVSVPVWIVIGYYLGHWFGDEISKILEQMEHMKSIVTWVIVAGIVFFAVRTWLGFRKAKRLAEQRRVTRAARP